MNEDNELEELASEEGNFVTVPVHVDDNVTATAVAMLALHRTSHLEQELVSEEIINSQPFIENEQSKDAFEEEEEESTVRPVEGLAPVSKCCTHRKCFTKFAPEVQEDCFNRFWAIPTKTNQNYFLAGLMSADEPKRTVQKPKRNNKTATWTYFVDVRGKKVQVCQNFLTAVYGISKCKLSGIQHKLVHGAPLDDMRGKYQKNKSKRKSNFDKK